MTHEVGRVGSAAEPAIPGSVRRASKRSPSWHARLATSLITTASLVTAASLAACGGGASDPGSSATGDGGTDASGSDGSSSDGSNSDGSNSDGSSPDGGGPDGGGTRLVRISVRKKTVYALSPDRTRIYGWGSNASRVIRKTPSDSVYEGPVSLDIDGIPAGPYRKIVSSDDKTCVLTDSGEVYCFGDAGPNDSLGNGDSESHGSAVKLAAGDIPAGVKVVGLDISAFTSCAVGDDGEAYCWGDFHRVPDLDPSLATVTAPRLIVRGNVPGEITDVSTAINRSCVLAEGRPYCWFLDEPELIPPGELPAGAKLLALRINDDFSCAAADDGEIYCFGTASGRRFGAGASDFVSNSPLTRVSRAHLPANVRFQDVTVGGIAGASCGLGSDGWAYCWGSGEDGAVGDGELGAHDVLAPVAVERGEVPSGVTFVGLNCGTYHCSGEGSDGFVYSWGSNEDGVLAVPVSSLPRVAHPVRASAARD